MYFVYLLLCSDNSTYIGATVDLEKRLRQHNQEIKGGARMTGAKVKKGESWNRVMYVSGFPNWQSALQFEWRWKQISRMRRINNITPIQNRICALSNLFNLDKPTTNSLYFSEWENQPTIHIESNNDHYAHYLMSLYVNCDTIPPFVIV